MRAVRIQGMQLPIAEVEGCVLLPRVLEAMDVCELGSIGACVDQHPERAARIDRLQLRPVPHQEDLRTRVHRDSADAIEGQRAGEGCFVDDDELAGAHRRVPLAIVEQPLGRVLSGDTEVVGKFASGGSGRRETDDRATPVLVLPREPKGMHRRRLVDVSGLTDVPTQ